MIRCEGPWRRNRPQLAASVCACVVVLVADAVVTTMLMRCQKEVPGEWGLEEVHEAEVIVVLLLLLLLGRSITGMAVRARVCGAALLLLQFS